LKWAVYVYPYQEKDQTKEGVKTRHRNVNDYMNILVVRQ